MKDNREVFGSFERVSIPSLGIINAVAKVDTGAYSGALHCSKIREYTSKIGGKKILKFVPSNNHGHTQEVSHFVRSYIRSSTGHRTKRYLFDTKIVIKDKEYPIRIGLSDRSDMNYEILIGRRFLRENNLLVDVIINQELDTDLEKKS